MSTFNIFERSTKPYRDGRRLTYVRQVSALDAFDAVMRFCGQKSSTDYVAMPEGWEGSSTYRIMNKSAMPAIA